MAEGKTEYVRGQRKHILWLLGLGSLAVTLGWVFPDLLTPAHWVGYAVCHQLPTHSYRAFGHPLPLCARCTGQYLGAITAIAYILWLGRARAIGLPNRLILLLFGVMLALWALDGLNSFLAFVGLPHLYEPANVLRLITGGLEGMVLSTLFWPFWAGATWQEVDTHPVLAGGGELARLLVLEALILLAIDQGGDTVRYMLGILSTVGVLLLLSMVFSLMLRLVLRKERAAITWGDTVGYMVGGVVLGTALIIGVDLLRFYLLPPI